VPLIFFLIFESPVRALIAHERAEFWSPATAGYVFGIEARCNASASGKPDAMEIFRYLRTKAIK